MQEQPGVLPAVGRGETGPCEQREQGEPQGPAHPARGQAFWLQRFTTRSTNGAGCSQRGLTLAPRRAWHTGAAGLAGNELPWLRVEAAGFGRCALPRVCDLFKFPSEAFHLLQSGSASVSAQECGPVWLGAGQTDGKLCLRVLRAHI